MKKERVFFEGKEIIFVGTAHISRESVEMAKAAILEENPDAVGVELDFQRYKQLLHGEKWKDLNISQVIESGQTYLLLVNILLSNLQRQLGEKVGVAPGSEMIEAVNVAREQNIPVELLDRDVRTTFSRAISKMGIIEKLRFGYFIILSFFGVGAQEFSSKKIEDLKDTDLVNELIQQLSKQFPSVKKVLVDERDQFIAERLKQSRAQKIVAVIGLGHLEGVKKSLSTKTDLNELMKLDKRPSIFKLLHYVVPLLFAALLVYAFFFKGIESSLNIFIAWFLVHAVLSGLGALIGGGHPITIATAFIAAPFTALHPILAAGWFAGLAEARIKNPKVKDFEELKNLNSFSDFSKNQVTRILLIVALSNLGSTIATIIAFPLLVKMIA